MGSTMAKDQTEFGDGRPALEDVKEMRRSNPSGWLALSMDPTRALLIDAILDSPDGYEFTPPEIAPRAGISDQSVRNHLPVLRNLGIVKSKHSKYVVRGGSPVMSELEELNSAVTAVRSGQSPDRSSSFDPDELMDNARSEGDPTVPEPEIDVRNDQSTDEPIKAIDAE